MGHSQQCAAADLEMAADLGSPVTLEQPVKFLERVDSLVPVEEEDCADGRPDVGSMSSRRSMIMQQLGIDHGVNHGNNERVDMGSVGIVKTNMR
jgi:hypothetical protein